MRPFLPFVFRVVRSPLILASVLVPVPIFSQAVSPTAAPPASHPVAPAAAQTSTAKSPAKAVAPPVWVDRALRARVTAFLADEAAGAYRKSFEMVAEDTKEYYLSVAKEKASADAKIVGITYSDQFHKATVVSSTVEHVTLPGTGAVNIPSSRTDRWKLEKGLWMWYRDPAQDCGITLIGPVPCAGANLPAKGSENSAHAAPPPKEMTPEALEARSKMLLKAGGLDKALVQFVAGTAGTAEVVYHNGYTGLVRVLAGLNSPVEGITVEPGTALANPKSDLKITITYTPTNKPVGGAALDVQIEPFGTKYRVPIQMLAADAAGNTTKQ